VTATRDERRRSFGPVERLTRRRSRWYDADDYLALIGTYSDHLTLSPEQRDKLFAALRSLIDERFEGRVRREFEAAYTSPVAPTTSEEVGQSLASRA